MQNEKDSRNLNMKKETNIFFWLSLICYMLFLFLNNLAGLNIPIFFFVILAGIYFLFFNTNQSIAFTMAFSLLATGIQIAYVVALCLIFLIIKENKKIDLNMFYLPFILLIFWETIHLFIAPSSIIEHLRYTIIFAYLAFIICNRNLNLNNKLILYVYISFTLVVCINILLQTLNLTGSSITNFVSSGLRLGYAEQVIEDGQVMLAADPNLLGQNIALAISCLIVLIAKGYNKVICITAIILFIGFGFLTLSKTFIVTAVVIVIYTILSSLLSNRKNIIKGSLVTFGTISTFILVFLVSKTIFSDSFNSLISRFSESDLTTGRFDVFVDYFNYLIENPLVLFFGIGLQEVGIKSGLMVSPHNSLQEIIIVWGIVGIFLVASIIFILIKNAREKMVLRINLINYLPLIVFLFMAQSTQLFRLRDRVLIFVLVFAALQIKSINERNDIKSELKI